MLDKELLKALSGAAATIIAAALAGTLPEFFKRRAAKQSWFNSPRIEAIPGIWIGKGTDFYVENGTEFLPFTLRLDLKREGRRITGKGELEGARPPLVVDGGFQSDSYLQMTYRSEDPKIMQLGGHCLPPHEQR